MWHALFKQQWMGNSHHLLVWAMKTWININTMIATYSTAMTDAVGEKLGKGFHKKTSGSPEMFSTSVMRGEI